MSSVVTYLSLATSLESFHARTPKRLGMEKSKNDKDMQKIEKAEKQWAIKTQGLEKHGKVNVASRWGNGDKTGFREGQTINSNFYTTEVLKLQIKDTERSTKHHLIQGLQRQEENPKSRMCRLPAKAQTASQQVDKELQVSSVHSNKPRPLPKEERKRSQGTGAFILSRSVWDLNIICMPYKIINLKCRLL